MQCKGCDKITKVPRAFNWKLYQLCNRCYTTKILNQAPMRSTSGGTRYGDDSELVIFNVPETKHLNTIRQS